MALLGLEPTTSCTAGEHSSKELLQQLMLQYILYGLFAGKPSQPLIVGDREGRERYTYDLEWEVRSAYPIVAHEVAYWETDKVTY
jgi:hypothetical protein